MLSADLIQHGDAETSSTHSSLSPATSTSSEESGVRNGGSSESSDVIEPALNLQLASVAETLQRLRDQLLALPAQSCLAPQLDYAIFNTLEAARRSGKILGNDLNFEEPQKSFQHPRLSTSYHTYEFSGGMSHRSDDEDEYDRLAYEFPIHPLVQLRRTAGNSSAPFGKSSFSSSTSSSQTKDVAVGRNSGSIFCSEKGSNTSRALNVSRAVQAGEVAPAKLSRQVQTYVHVTDSSVGTSKVDFQLRGIIQERSTQTDWLSRTVKVTQTDSVTHQVASTLTDRVVMRNEATGFEFGGLTESVGIQTIPPELPPRVYLSSCQDSGTGASRTGSVSSQSKTSSVVEGGSNTPTSGSGYQLLVRIDQSPPKSPNISRRTPMPSRPAVAALVTAGPSISPPPALPPRPTNKTSQPPATNARSSPTPENCHHATIQVFSPTTEDEIGYNMIQSHCSTSFTSNSFVIDEVKIIEPSATFKSMIKVDDLTDCSRCDSPIKQKPLAPKVASRIVQRHGRDTSMRAWCSIDNLLPTSTVKTIADKTDEMKSGTTPKKSMPKLFVQAENGQHTNSHKRAIGKTRFPTSRIGLAPILAAKTSEAAKSCHDIRIIPPWKKLFFKALGGTLPVVAASTSALSASVVEPTAERIINFDVDLNEQRRHVTKVDLTLEDHVPLNERAVDAVFATEPTSRKSTLVAIGCDESPSTSRHHHRFFNRIGGGLATLFYNAAAASPTSSVGKASGFSVATSSTAATAPANKFLVN